MLCCAWHLQLCLPELDLRICFFIITWVGAKTLFSGIFFFLSSFRKKRTLEQTKKTTDMETSKSQLTCLCLSYFICACMHVCMIAWLLSRSVVFDFLRPHGPSFSVHGIFQARILEWGATSFSGGTSWPRGRTHVSCISCIGRWVLYMIITVSTS